MRAWAGTIKEYFHRRRTKGRKIMTLTCDKCAHMGLGFYSDTIGPADYLEGKTTADIWIVGLNPKHDIGHVEQRTPAEFADFDPDCHPYFWDFRKVSPALYANWKSQNSRIAHTDLVKCFSPSFPAVVLVNGSPREVNSKQVVKNCSTHLLEQIRRFRPKVIICNGAPVCYTVMGFFPPNNAAQTNRATSYKYELDLGNDTKHSFWLVLSGFIGRIDDWNKRRLGVEIEGILASEGIELHSGTSSYS
ncbi:uracil-DNA glycosylase family protein [Hymenobacter humi]|uniref:Uracil-DNA glycosylase family protein n=1 Tax=Hymenobacter humi TaxID=1411620 RepID=A0ABW2UCW8_9BACT